MTDAKLITTTSSNRWWVFDVDQNVFVEAQSNLIVMVYQAHNLCDEMKVFSEAEREQVEEKEEEEEVVVDEKQELENGLLELVKCAARSKHLQNGLVF